MSEERRCPECGAPLGEARACEELFHAALAMEWVDPPSTAEAHHLLVGTYMLQHPSRFTPEAREMYREMIVSIVDEGLSAPQLRERNRGRFDQQQREFDLKLKTPDPPTFRHWRATIADAIDGPAEGLPERVWRWGRAVREDLRTG